jgi:spore maturation protein CgeB
MATKVLIVDTTIYLGRPLLSIGPPTAGLDVRLFDEAPFVKLLQSSPAHKLIYRALGRRPLSAWALNNKLCREAAEFRPDVVIISKGAYVFPRTLRRVKALGAVLVNYATDDPFNPRNGDGWLKASIPEYDLYACTKRAIMDDVRRSGAGRTSFVKFGYNPDLHFPEPAATTSEAKTFESDVAFIGTADADRFPYLDALLSIPGLKLALFGSYWDRQPARFSRLARGMANGRNYRLALSGTKIALGLLRSANRDRHTMRTFEIPACGALLCAERTDEHEEIFNDGTDALLFDGPDDLKHKVLRYLTEPTARQTISQAGFSAVREGSHTYADRIREMVTLVRPEATADASSAALACAL